MSRFNIEKDIAQFIKKEVRAYPLTEYGTDLTLSSLIIEKA